MPIAPITFPSESRSADAFKLVGMTSPLAVRQGQGFVLAAGTGHRGRNPTGAVTRLFLIDDPA